MEKTMTNKKLGTSFESSFCEALFNKGYWVHNMAQNQAGQPADVIAAKDGNAYLIDCKVCSKNYFPFSRVEENQHYAMKLWEDCGNGQGWFALLLEDKVFMISHSIINRYRASQTSFNTNDIRTVGISLSEWLALGDK